MRKTSFSPIVFAGLSLTVFLFASVFNSCKKEDICDETKISQAGSNESHNAGLNCMSCHKVDGEGEGCFSVAGTTYNPGGTAIYPDAKVLLFTGPDGSGSVSASLTGDAKGNFYSTVNMTFGSGLYPAVVSAVGDTSFMPDPIVTGACNSCHGVTTSTIRVN